jgi:molecular chaperone GrpE
MENEKQEHTQPAAKQEKHEHAAKEHKHEEKKQGHAAPGGEKHGEGCDCASLNDKYLRISAEFDNYKKRSEKEKGELCRASEARLMLRLLPIYGEAKLAAAEAGKLPDSETKKGVLMVLAKLLSQFEKEGLQPMKLEGEKLDPFRHEVALTEESGAPEGTIVRVVKPGYFYKGEVLQHALVSVSSGKAGEEKKEGKEGKRG